MCCDNCDKKSKRYYQVLDDKFCEVCAMWRTANVFTKAPGFSPNSEIKELQIITVRPNETEKQALIREGFNPDKSRIEVI